MRHTLGAAFVVVAAASCRPDRGAPSGFTLLFFNHSPAAVVGDRSWAPDPDHSRLVAFDRALQPVRTLAGPAIALPMSVTALGADLLVSEEAGDGVVLDTAGQQLREWSSPAPFAVASYNAAAGRIVATRSPYRVPTLAAEPADAPLVQLLDTLGRPVDRLAAIHVPPTPFLTAITNAGPAVLDGGGGVYYAPLVRDEIVKFDRSGMRRWVTRRGLYPKERDPVYLPARGRDVRIDQAIVNVAIVLGPDGRLYVLGADDSAGTKLRVDVLDTAGGAILATRHLGPRETAVALDAGGRLATFDAESLGARVPGGSREPFAPAFTLPDTSGDTLTLARFAGKVTLVDFWASWCDPCREEFPHMIDLYRSYRRSDFDIVAISDDVDRAKMLAFLRQYRPPFAVLVGGGRMKQQYHYRGLPYSVLLDRSGRVIERYFGFGGVEEFQRLAATVERELAASPAPAGERSGDSGTTLVGAGDIADCDSDGDEQPPPCSTASPAPCSPPATTRTAMERRSSLRAATRGAGDGTERGHDPPREPRLQERRRGALLSLLWRARGARGTRVLQLRHRGVARDLAQQQHRHARRIAAGAVAAERPGGAPQRVRARLLAPSALQLGYGARQRPAKRVTATCGAY